MVPPSRVGFRAALLYFANWFFIGQSTNYFAEDLQASPVLHFWSLSIEEQFYLVWPLLLIGLLALKRRLGDRIWVLPAIVGTAALGSLAWALHLAHDDVNRAYYGTDARAYQLLAGCVARLSPALFQRVSGPAVVGTAERTLAHRTRGPGLMVHRRGPDPSAAHLPRSRTGALLLSLEAGSGWTKRALSTAPMTYLGRISYGTYLWHWPVIVIAGLTMELSPLGTVALSAVVATGIAALSSHLIEIPIRESRSLHQVPRVVIASGLAASAVAAVLIVPHLARPDRPRTNVATAADESAGPSADDAALVVDWVSASQDKASPTYCVDADPTECVVRKGTGPHLTLVGDSHAIAMIPAFEVVADELDLTLSVAVDWGCSWPYDLRYVHHEPSKHKACARRRTDWFERVIPALDSDIVVLDMLNPDDPKRPVAVLDENGDRVDSHIAEVILPGADRVIQQLRDDGRIVVLIEPLPAALPVQNPLDCLSEEKGVDRCVYQATVEPTELEQAFRACAAADDGIFSVNLDSVVCPAFPRCDAVVDGVVTKWDESHITAPTARRSVLRCGQARRSRSADRP